MMRSLEERDIVSLFFFLFSFLIEFLALKQEKITEFGVTRRREKKGEEEYTQDGSVDRHGRPAVKAKSGGWQAGILLLGIILTQLLPTSDTIQST